jgi:NhaC family Na+:H+ antiporter
VALAFGSVVEKAGFIGRLIAPVLLSRSLGDSAAVTSALIPWNSCWAFMAATLGVATVAYAPFTCFNILSPLISVAMAFLGMRMLKATSPESSPKS